MTGTCTWRTRIARAFRTELPLRQWWWLPPAWMLIGLLFSLQPLVWGELPWREVVHFEALRWWPWLLLAPATVWLALRLPLIGPRWKLALLIHVLASLATATAIDQAWLHFHRAPQDQARAGMFTHFHERMGANIDRPPHWLRDNRQPGSAPFARHFGAFWTLRLRLVLPLYWSLVGAALLLLLQIRTRRTARMEAQLAEAQLAALQMQLQPHFLFNSLNAISSLVRKQPDVADGMICALGSLLRASLENQKRKEIPLREELALARHYLGIQQRRFGPRLQISEAVDEALLEAAVPPLLLQPLLENAVTHGLANQSGSVSLRVWSQDGTLHLVVTNRSAPGGAPATASTAGTGIGLSNTRARLEALYGARANLELRETPNGYTAEARLPLHRFTA